MAIYNDVRFTLSLAVFVLVVAVSMLSLSEFNDPLVALFFSNGCVSHEKYLFVSASNGNDTDNHGKNSKYPLRTIQRASELATPGTTILVEGGIYRERISPPLGGTQNAPIKFKSIELHGAIVRGSVPWYPTEKVRAGIWKGALGSAHFTDRYSIDGPNPFRVAISGANITY